MDKHKILFDRYIDSQSNERKMNIVKYEKFIQRGRLISIKVIMKNGDCLIVYCNKKNELLWY